MSLLFSNIRKALKGRSLLKSSGGITFGGLSVHTNADITTPTDFAHTVISGTDLLVVMIQGYESGVSFTASWNGGTESMTEIDITAGTWLTDQQFVAVLANPTPGTDNVTLDFSGSSAFDDGGIIHIFNLSGVDLTVGTDGVRALAGSDSGGTPITLAPTVAEGDLIITQWSIQTTTNLGATYGGTSGTQVEEDATAFNGDVAFLTTSLATGSGQTVSWDPDAGTYPSGVSISIAKLAAPVTWDFEDDFNRSNEALSTSANWNALAGTNDPAIVGNELYVTTDGGTPSVGILATTYGPDVELEFTLGTTNSGSGSTGFLVGYNTTTYNGYLITQGTSYFTIIRSDSGVPTEINATPNTSVFGDIYRVVRSGASILIYKNAALLVSISDSTYTTGTQHGIYISSSSGERSFDNFKIRAL